MDPRCSGVEVKVLEIGNTQVKYKYLKIVLKYSTLVNVLGYFTPLNISSEYTIKLTVYCIYSKLIKQSQHTAI